MRLRLLILFLLGWLSSYAQPSTGTYTPISSTKYNWWGGYFRGLHLPASGDTVLRSDLWRGAGAVMVDTTGSNKGLYIWYDNYWHQAGSGALFGDADIIATAQRTFNQNGNNFIYTGTGNFIINNQVSSQNAKFRVTKDSYSQYTMVVGDSTSDWMFSSAALAAIRQSDTIRTATVGNRKENTLLVVREDNIMDSGILVTSFMGGSRFLREIRLQQHVKLHSWGGDFQFAAASHLQLRKYPGYSGPSIVGTQNDGSPIQAIPTHLSILQLRGSTSSSNYIRTTGWQVVNMAYAISTAFDTLDNVAFNMTLSGGIGKVKRSVDYMSEFSGFGTTDSSFAFLARWKKAYNFLQQLTIGNHIDGESRPNHASAIVDIWDTQKGILFPRMNTTLRDAISSPATGLHISNTDSSGKMDYYNGSAWVGYGASTGGGSATTIYNGNGAISSDRTVDGDGNDLFITDMEAFRIYGTGGTYGSVRLFETSGSAGTVTVGRNTAPNTTWSDSVYFSGLGQRIDTTVLKVLTLNTNSGTIGYSPWMYAGGGGVTDHGALTGLGDDDHSQYLLLAGRSGGQAGIGGSGVTDKLSWKGTTGNGTVTVKAHEFLVGNNGAFDAMSIYNSGSVLFGNPTYDANNVINARSLTNTGTHGLKIWALNLSQNSQYGYNTITSTAQFILSPTSTVAINGTGLYIGTIATPSARLHIIGGTTSAGSSAIKFTAGSLMSTIEALTKEANANGTYQTSTALNRYAEGGYIKDFFTEVNNVTTTETDLYSYTTKANTFAADGEKLFAEFSGTTTGHATATRTWQIYFGGSSISTSASFFTGIDAVGLDWKVKVTGTRRSSSSIVWNVEYTIGSSGVTCVTDVALQTGLTLSGTNVFKITGQAGAAGAGSDQIKAQSGIIAWYGASNN